MTNRVRLHSQVGKIINTYDLLLLLNPKEREMNRCTGSLEPVHRFFFDACCNRILLCLSDRKSKESSWTKPSKLLHGAIE